MLGQPAICHDVRAEMMRTRLLRAIATCLEFFDIVSTSTSAAKCRSVLRKAMRPQVGLPALVRWRRRRCCARPSWQSCANVVQRFRKFDRAGQAANERGRVSDRALPRRSPVPRPVQPCRLSPAKGVQPLRASHSSALSLANRYASKVTHARFGDRKSVV